MLGCAAASCGCVQVPSGQTARYAPAPAGSSYMNGEQLLACNKRPIFLWSLKMQACLARGTPHGCLLHGDHTYIPLRLPVDQYLLYTLHVVS